MGKGKKKTPQHKGKQCEYSVKLALSFVGNTAVEAVSKKEAVRIAERILKKDGPRHPQYEKVLNSIDFNSRIKYARFEVLDAVEI